MAAPWRKAKHAGLRDWQRASQIPDTDWLSEAAASEQLKMRPLRLRLLAVAGDIDQAYNAAGDPGYDGPSIERFITWRADLPLWRKLVRWMFWWIRLV